MKEPTAYPSRLATPLEQRQMEELDRFLLSDATADATMMLDCLDGYLTAIVSGPTAIKTSTWLPGVWGPSEKDEPVFDSYAQAQRILELILHQRNGIVASLQRDADSFVPVFDTVEYEGETQRYLDGEMWARGYLRGIKLCERDWQPLLDDAQHAALLRPLQLLGAPDLSAEEEALVATPAQREALTKQIPSSVAALYRYWQPLRKESVDSGMTTTFQREQAKTGRNDPCPCGSGKKFKKCCGATTLH